jgi:hypothetical protein
MVPEGLTVSSGPSPAKIGSLTAVAGGDPTIVSFTWILICSEKGSYYLNATISTSDCGSREEAQLVHVIKGASISNPQTFPKEPTTDQDLSISFEASYSVGDISVEAARIFYLFSEKDLDLDMINVENGMMYYEDGLLGEGGIVECIPDPIYEGSFKGIIPIEEKEYLYYWIQVTDERGDTTTSSVRQVRVEDTGKVHLLNLISFLIVGAGMILVVLSLIFIYRWSERKRIEAEQEDRFTVLGSFGRKRYMTEQEKSNYSVVKRNNWFYVIIFAVITIALFCVLIGILTGDAARLFEHFREGI